MKSLLMLFTIAVTAGLFAGPATGFAALQAPLQLSSQADVQTDTLDIIGPVQLPAPWPWKTMAATATAGLLVILLTLYLYRRRSQGKLGPSAAETALEEIRLLGPEPEGQGARIYLDAISGILRQYIEARMGLRSTKQTTREFLNSITLLQGAADTHLFPRQSQELKRYLEIFDQAKFAHQIPQRADMPLIKNAIVEFITETEASTERERD